MRGFALGLLSLAACARVEVRPPPPPVAVSGGLLSVEVESSSDGGDLPSLVASASEALHEIERWGGLRVPTHIVVLPDHAALEERAHRHGYGWLRAWARYDVIYLQAPRTWNFLGIRPSRGELRAILTHELTHCTMYQEDLRRELSSTRRPVPLWFGGRAWRAGPHTRQSGG